MLTLTTLNADSTLATLNAGQRMIVRANGWPMHLTAPEMVGLGYTTLHLESRAGQTTHTIDLAQVVRRMKHTPRTASPCEGL